MTVLTRRHFLAQGATACSVCGMLPSGLLAQDATSIPHLCAQLEIEDSDIAKETASYENEDNVYMVEAQVLVQKRWNPSRRFLSVDFVSEPDYIDKVVEAARGWEPYLGIPFRFGRGAPDILVAFDEGGSWSYIGTDSKYYSDRSIASMNFGWFSDQTDSPEINRTVLHEFGHAVALVHEHQAPSSTIPWNMGELKKYYQSINSAYDEAWITRNILNKYSQNQINGSAYDSTSIMHYPIPKEVLLDDSFAVGWNTELSDLDEAVAETLFD